MSDELLMQLVYIVSACTSSLFIAVALNRGERVQYLQYSITTVQQSLIIYIASREYFISKFFNIFK